MKTRIDAVGKLGLCALSMLLSGAPACGGGRGTAATPVAPAATVTLAVAATSVAPAAMAMPAAAVAATPAATAKSAVGVVIAAAAPAATAKLAAVIQLLRDTPRIIITFPRMPPTRTYCIIEDDEGKDSAIVEWDPLRPGSLIRSMTMQPDPSVASTGYKISCFSDPARHAIEPSVNFAWEFNSDNTIGFCDRSRLLSATPSNGTPNERSGQDPLTFVPSPACPLAAAVIVSIKQIAKPSFILSGTNKVDLAKEASKALPGNAGPLRSFGGVSDEAVNELFQVIAQVAAEKVRSKGMKLLEGRVHSLVCKQLKRPGTNQLVLPRTCDAVKGVRLEDLAGAGRQMLDAMAQDFVLAAVEELIEAPLGAETKVKDPTNELRPAVQIVVQAALDMISYKQEKVRGAGQRILVALSQTTWPASDGDVAMAVNYAFQVIAECHRTGKTNPALIHAMLSNPERFFSLGTEKVELRDLKQTALKEMLKKWTQADTFVANGLRVLSPPSDTTEAAQIRAAAGLVFDVLDLYAAAAEDTLGKLPSQAYQRNTDDDEAKTVEDAANPGTQSNPGVPRAGLKHSAKLRVMRELVNASIQQDIGGVVAASSRLIGAWKAKGDFDPKIVRQVTALAGAIGAYLSTYSSGQKPTEADLAARQEARKAALNSIIDAQRERGQRLGDNVFSLGASLYPMLGYAYVTGKDGNRGTGSFQFQPMAIAPGLAFDHHGLSRVGLHIELSPLNLGNYLTVRTKTFTGDASEVKGADVVKPSPADALSPSGTVALTYLIPDVDLIVIGGATLGYSFKLGDGEDVKANRAFYVGGLVGVYIPFFDFN